MSIPAAPLLQNEIQTSMPSRASSSLELVVTMSCGLSLQICLIIALSFHCRCCLWPSLTGMEDCSLHIRAVHAAVCLEREVAGRENR